MTQGVARNSAVEEKWVKISQISRRNSGTSNSSPRPSRTSFTVPLRASVGFRQGAGGPGLVLLGHPGVKGPGLDAGVAKLVLDNLQVAPARLPEGCCADRKLGECVRKRARGYLERP